MWMVLVQVGLFSLYRILVALWKVANLGGVWLWNVFMCRLLGKSEEF